MAYISKINLPNGQTYDIKSNNIICDTVEGWAEKSSMVSQEGFVYVYTNYKVVDGQNIPGIKIGTDNAYIVDLPFVDEVYARHITDTIIHITNEERLSWNNKVTCYIDPIKDDKLVFSKE